MPRNICSGQRIRESKYLEAKLLRRRMTQAEKVLWRQLRKNQIGNHHFRRQQIIAGFIVDFYCHEANLVIEVDGDVHLINKERDLERDAILQVMGFRILRFYNKEVLRDVGEVVRVILTACAVASDLTPPSPAPPPPLPLRPVPERSEGRRGGGGWGVEGLGW